MGTSLTRRCGSILTSDPLSEKHTGSRYLGGRSVEPNDQLQPAASDAGRSGVIENPSTGEVVEYLHDDTDRLVWRATWRNTGRRTLPHRHPGMEERWTVVEGIATF